MNEPIKINLWGEQPPGEAHKAIMRDKHRFQVLVAGRKFRKTSVGIVKLFKGALTTPLTFPFIAPFRSQARNIVWDDHVARMIGILDKAEIKHKVRDNAMEVIIDGGGKFKVDGADNEEALRGIGNWGGLVLSEYSDWKDDVWSPIIRPNLMTTKAWALIEGTPKGFNHLHSMAKKGDHNNIIEGQLYGEDGHIMTPDEYLDKDFQTFRYTSYDNPYLDVEEIESAKRDSTPEWFNQEYLAQFTKYTGLVYKDFNRLIHVQELPDFQPVYYIRGLDRGFTNPTAVPIIAVNSDGDWYQTHELYRTKLTNPELSLALNEIQTIAGVPVFEFETMDSANAGDIQELLDLGHGFIGVKKESGESSKSYVRWKIQKFAERLRIRENGLPRYWVHPRCVNTLREFESYKWPETRAEQNADENPLKVNDHMMDALADLNAMYMHEYEPTEKKPWEGKVKGTYVPSAEEEEENDQFRVVRYEEI